MEMSVYQAYLRSYKTSQISPTFYAIGTEKFRLLFILIKAFSFEMPLTLNLISFLKKGLSWCKVGSSSIEFLERVDFISPRRRSAGHFVFKVITRAEKLS